MHKDWQYIKVRSQTWKLLHQRKLNTGKEIQEIADEIIREHFRGTLEEAQLGAVLDAHAVGQVGQKSVWGQRRASGKRAVDSGS